MKEAREKDGQSEKDCGREGGRKRGRKEGVERRGRERRKDESMSMCTDHRQAL